ncbi:MAG: ABC transporter substrate-binding protein [Alphaproteobacteria bacterium]|nr:ABC transporter substrate-binding protein [Alphaproteobacteria bacterium]
MIKRTALLLAALFTVSIAHAADDPPAKPDRPAEIIVTGTGEVMDALHRAVEDEIKTINEEGGVLGHPVKVTRIADDCAQSPEAAKASATQISARQPLVVFARQCKKTSDQSAKIYAESNALVLGIPVDAPCSQLISKHQNLFCLGQNHSATQELAFNIATENPSNIVLLYPDFPAAKQVAEVMIRDLRSGFTATKEEEDRWAKLLPEPAYKISSHVFAGGVPFAISEIGKIAASIAESPTTSLYYIGPTAKPSPVLAAATALGWKGKIYYSPLPTEKTPPEWLSLLAPETEVFAIRQQPSYIGQPPAGAKAYTAFHPDWVAGFWQVMKAVKYAKSLDGREIAKSLGGKPFFSRAPWLMLQSRSRYRPPEMLQRFNDNGDLRMAGYKIEKIRPKE